MKTVLSTKKLSSPQKELFLNSGLGLVEYDALQIEFLDVNIPLEYTHYILTSKNSVKAFVKKIENRDTSNFQVFCVGEKTKALLEENGLRVVKMTEYASELAQYIIKEHHDDAFLFLSGNQRRDTLPKALTENNIRYKEVVVYKTHLVPRAFQRDFDGILFFSPSGIRSYLLENSIGSSTLFCIGTTTADEAKKHSDHIVIANKPTVENVLVQAINHFARHD